MRRKVVCIDFGHGGKDPGAVANGIKEKIANRKVALKLGELFKKAGYVVIYTHTEDDFVELSDRVKIAQKAGAEFFISVHHNAGGGKGYEIIYEVDQPETKTWATTIANEFAAIGRPKHGAGIYSKSNSTGKEDYFAVLRNGKMLGIITEFAYLDSADYKNIDTEKELEAEAICIFNGTHKFNR